MFERLGKMALEATRALVAFTMQGAEAADRMGKLAQTTGVSVESFSRMAYAGQLSGVSAEGLSAAMVKLDKAMAEASGGTGKQAQLFAQLGVKVNDASGHMRGADAVMKDVADRFASMEDGAAKTALATELFGKAGAELIPMMNEGGVGLAKMADEADRLGITISTGASASAAAFNDNMQKLRMAFQAVGQRAAAELTPALAKLTDQLLSSEGGAEALRMASDVLATTLRVLATGGVIIGAVFEAVGKTLARVASAITNVMKGRFEEAFNDLKGQFIDIGDASTKAVDRLVTIWAESGEAAEGAAEKTKKATEVAVKALKELAAAELDRHGRGTSAQRAPHVLSIDAPLEHAGRGKEDVRHSEERARSTHKESFEAVAASSSQLRVAAMEAAASAGSWGEAMVRLKADFDASFKQLPDFGAELQVWAARMGPQLAAAGTQMLGAVGDLVNSVVQGAQAGGVWGAVIAAFMEVAKRTQSALAFLDTAMQFVEKIAEQVEPLVAPIFAALQGVLEIVVDVVAPVFKALQPFFNAIAGLVEDLSPVLFALGDLVASVSPLLEFVGMVIGRIFETLKPVFTMIAGVVKVLATVTLGVLIGLNELAAAFGDTKAADEAKRMREMVDSMWADGDKASSDLTARSSATTTTTGDVMATGKVTATGPIEMKEFDLTKYGLSSGKPMDVIDIGGWGYAAGSVAGAEAARAFVEAAAAINGATAEAAAAAGQAAYDDFLALGSAASGAAQALDKFSSSLTNVPQGFRYTAAAFNAQEVGGYAPAPGTGRDAPIVIHVAGSVLTEHDLLTVIERGQRARQFRRTGVGG